MLQFGALVEQAHFAQVEQLNFLSPKGRRIQHQLINIPKISFFGRPYTKPTYLTLHHIMKLFRLYLANISLQENGNIIVDTAQAGSLVPQLGNAGLLDTWHFSQRYQEDGIHPPFGSVIMKRLEPRNGAKSDIIIENTGSGILIVEDYQNHLYMSNDKRFYTGNGSGNEGEPICETDFSLSVAKAEEFFIDETGCPVPVGGLVLDINGKKYSAGGIANRKIDDIHIPGLSLAFGNFTEGSTATIKCSKDLEAIFEGALKVIDDGEGWGFDPNNNGNAVGGIFTQFPNIPEFSNIANTTERVTVTAKLHPDGWVVSKGTFPANHKAGRSFYIVPTPTSVLLSNPFLPPEILISLEAPTWISDLFNIFLERMYGSYSTKYSDFPSSASWVKPIQDLFQASVTEVAVPRSLPPEAYGGRKLITDDLIIPIIGQIEGAEEKEDCFERALIDNPPILDISPSGIREEGKTGLQTNGTTLVKKGHIFNAHASLETWFGSTIFADKMIKALVFDSVSTVRSASGFLDDFTSIEDINPNEVWPIKSFTPSNNEIAIVRDFNGYNYIAADGQFLYFIESKNKELTSIQDVKGLSSSLVSSVDSVYSSVLTSNLFIATGTQTRLNGTYSIAKSLPVDASTIGNTNPVFFWNANGTFNDEVKWHSFIVDGNQWLIWSVENANEGTFFDPSKDMEEMIKIDLSNIGSGNLVGGVPGHALTLKDYAIFVGKSDGELKVARQSKMFAWTQEQSLVNPMEVPTMRREVFDEENVYFAGSWISRNRVSLQPLEDSFEPEESLDISAFTKTSDHFHYLNCEQPNLMRAAVDMFATKNEEQEPIGEAILWDNVRFGFNRMDATLDYTEFEVDASGVGTPEIRGFFTPTWSEIFGEAFGGTISSVANNGDGTVTLTDDDNLFGKNGCQNNNEFVRDNWRPEPLPACGKLQIDGIEGELSMLNVGIKSDRASGFIKIRLPSGVEAGELSGKSFTFSDYNPKLIPIGLWYKDNILHALTNFGNLTKSLYVISIDVDKAVQNQEGKIKGNIKFDFPSSHLSSDRTHIVKDFCLFNSKYYFKIFSIKDNDIVQNGINKYYSIPEAGGETTLLLTDNTDLNMNSVAVATMPVNLLGEEVFITNDPTMPAVPDAPIDGTLCILDISFKKHKLANYFSPPVGNPYQFISEMNTLTLDDRQLFKLTQTIPMPSGITNVQQIAELHSARFNDARFQLATKDRAYRFSLGEKIDDENNQSQLIASVPYVGASVGGGLTDLSDFGIGNDATFTFGTIDTFIPAQTFLRQPTFESLFQPLTEAWIPPQATWNFVNGNLSPDTCPVLVDWKSTSPEGNPIDSSGNFCPFAVDGSGDPIIISTSYSVGFVRGLSDQNLVFDSSGELKTIISCWLHQWDNLSTEVLDDMDITAPGAEANTYDGRYMWSFDGSGVTARDLFQAKIQPSFEEKIFSIPEVISSGTGITTGNALSEFITPHAWTKVFGYLHYPYNAPWRTILDWKPDGSKAICEIFPDGSIDKMFAYVEINDDAKVGEPIWTYDPSSLGILPSGLLDSNETVAFGRHGSSDERFEYFNSNILNRQMYRWVPGNLSSIITENATNTGGTACIGVGAPKPSAYFVRDGFYCVQWFEDGVTTTCCLEHFAVADSSNGNIVREYEQKEDSGTATVVSVVGGSCVFTPTSLTCCGGDFLAIYGPPPLDQFNSPCESGNCSIIAVDCGYDETKNIGDNVTEYTTMINRPIITTDSDDITVLSRDEGVGACDGDTSKPSGVITREYWVEKEIVKIVNPGNVPFYDEIFEGGALRFRGPAPLGLQGDGTDVDDKFAKKSYGSTGSTSISLITLHLIDSFVATGKFKLNRLESTLAPGLQNLRPDHLSNIG